MKSTQQTQPTSIKKADLAKLLKQARKIALARLIDTNNGENNRVYDAINAALAEMQIIDL
ncbi:MAG: hypothetical protein AAF766_22930 [Cyanobacteria bacterium P01_D01_bin.14]